MADLFNLLSHKFRLNAVCAPVSLKTCNPLLTLAVYEFVRQTASGTEQTVLCNASVILTEADSVL